MSSKSSSNRSFHSPQISGFHCVGWVQSAHGIRGEIFVRLFSGTADWQGDVEDIALLPRSGADTSTPAASPATSLTIYKIERIKAHKDGLILNLDGVGDRNFAETLAKASVFVREEILQSAPGEPVYLRQLLDFQLIDREGKLLGHVAGFASNGPQDLLRVRTLKNEEALVPLVDDFLVHIDFDKQQVTMDLPPGLLDLSIV